MSKGALAEALATRANLKNLLRTRPNECMHDRSLAQHELCCLVVIYSNVMNGQHSQSLII